MQVKLGQDEDGAAASIEPTVTTMATASTADAVVDSVHTATDVQRMIVLRV